MTFITLKIHAHTPLSKITNRAPRFSAQPGSVRESFDRLQNTCLKKRDRGLQSKLRRH